MALSPEQIAEIRKNAGLSAVPPPPGVDPQAILEKRKASLAATEQRLHPPNTEAGGNAGQFAGNFLRSVYEPLAETGAFIEKGLDKLTGSHSAEGVEKAVETSKAAHADTFAGGVGDVAGTVAPYLVGGEGEAAGIGAKALKVGANMAKNTAIGTAQTDDLAQGIETGIGGEVVGALAKPIQAAGKAVYKGLAIPTSATEAQMLQAYKAKTPFMTRIASAITGGGSAPITAAETAFKEGLMGTESGIGVQAKRATGNLWKGIIAPALKRSGLKVNMPKFFDEAEAKIVADNPELSRQASLKEALDALREDYKDVGDIDISDLQDFKSGWAQDVPDKAYRGKPIAGAFRDVKNEVADLAREKLYEALGPEVKQAYIDYGNLKSLEEWGQKAMTGGKFKGGTGGFLSAAKDMVLTPIATIGGQTVYKVGQGIQFVGPPGVRYLSDLFNEDSQP